MAVAPLSPSEKRIERVVEVVRQLIQGRDDACGEVELALNSDSTTVQAPNCGAGSRIFMFPQTAVAAAEVTTTRVPKANVLSGQFTILHANNATAGRIFNWTARG